MKFKIGLFLIFLGSVFFTSEKFVDTENTVKFYFTVLALSVSVIIFLFRNITLNSEVQKLTSLSMLKGLFIVGVFQAIYGILQYTGKFPSNHNAFAITGSFENPAGFMAVLSLLFPIGAYWCIKSKKLEQRLIFFFVGLILFSVIIAGSRTGILAIVISTIVIFISECQLFLKIKNLKHTKLILLSAIILFLFGLFFLYKWKADSAKGRLLIWQVSAEMIKDQPLLGYGHGGFQANYMDYQAQYFERNPQSRLKQLADNTTHPFNEFIKIAVNFGIAGLLIYLLFLSYIFWKLIKTEHPQKSILLGCYVSFIIVSCFSYPLQYAPIWMLLGYYAIVVFSDWFPKKKLSLKIKIPIIGGCIFAIIFFSLRMNYEIKWNSISERSIQGQTNKMLPQYKELYSYLKHNELFLYNYGAELNVVSKYKESVLLLQKCHKKYNDYDLQMLLADNYYNIGDTIKAIRTYKYAENMVPCRFLPLYHQMKIYKKLGKVSKAEGIAQKIIEKQVKVKSATVKTIIKRAENYLNEKKMK